MDTRTYAERKAYRDEWRAKNAKRIKEASHADYEKHKEQRLDAHRAWNEQNPEWWDSRNRERVRANQHSEYWHRKGRRTAAIRSFGITGEQFDALLPQLENGPCDICGALGRLYLDHDHATRRFRGVLCHKCNVVLGMANDNPYILIAAAKYLGAHQYGT